MLRKFATIFGTLGIFAIGIFGIIIMGQLKPKKEFEVRPSVPPSVFFTVAKMAPATLDVNVQGEVRARTDINLTAQVGGRIVSTSSTFVDGGAFKKDQELLRIEDADYRLAVTRASARVAQAQQALSQEQAEADLARRDWEELGDGGAPSDLTLRKPQLAQAQANYQSAQADLSEARLNLSRTRVSAPFAGRIRRRIAGEGQFITPGAQLAEIFSTDVAEIRLPLTDENLATLGLQFGFIETPEKPGPAVTLSATIGANQHNWSGRITRTEGSIDTRTRQIGAIAVVDDPYGAGADNGVPLAIGLFVNALIVGQPYERAIMLPTVALHGRDTVYILDNEDKVRKKLVQVVASTPTSITVISGLENGDRVVISPLRGSDEGDIVTPVDSDAPDLGRGDQSEDDSTISDGAPTTTTAQQG